MKIAWGDGIFARPGYHTVSAASAQTCLNSNISSAAQEREAATCAGHSLLCNCSAILFASSYDVSKTPAVAAVMTAL